MADLTVTYADDAEEEIEGYKSFMDAPLIAGFLQILSNGGATYLLNKEHVKKIVLEPRE